MTTTFENDNDIIIHALEKIIDYARKNQYIFVAQSVWWIASIIGLTEGLVIHIDTLRIRSEVSQLSMKEALVTPRDLQRDLRIDIDLDYIHLVQAEQIIKKTKKFINNSWKERKAFKEKPDPLTHTRSGKILVKP